MEGINILVTVDENYIERLKVMLTSLFISNKGEKFNIYLIHKNVGENKIEYLSKITDRLGYGLFTIKADEGLFKNAPVTDRYPQEMYYRLCAHMLLPDNMDKILYLDPDILVINPLRPLWETNIDDFIFAAASHTKKSNIAAGVNKIRLGTESEYFNSGVLLINLKRARDEINTDYIFNYTAEHKSELLLPDQDVLNALYGNMILGVDDIIWNYDARRYNFYLISSGGAADFDWVMKNTAVLHFCGRAKPWNKRYIYRFGGLYKHYERLAEIYTV